MIIQNWSVHHSWSSWIFYDILGQFSNLLSTNLQNFTIASDPDPEKSRDIPSSVPKTCTPELLGRRVLETKSLEANLGQAPPGTRGTNVWGVSKKVATPAGWSTIEHPMKKAGCFGDTFGYHNFRKAPYGKKNMKTKRRATVLCVLLPLTLWSLMSDAFFLHEWPLVEYVLMNVCVCVFPVWNRYLSHSFIRDSCIRFVSVWSTDSLNSQVSDSITSAISSIVTSQGTYREPIAACLWPGRQLFLFPPKFPSHIEKLRPCQKYKPMLGKHTSNVSKLQVANLFQTLADFAMSIWGRFLNERQLPPETCNGLRFRQESPATAQH